MSDTKESPCSLSAFEQEAPEKRPPKPEQTDFFDNSDGVLYRNRLDRLLFGDWRGQRRKKAIDCLFDARLMLNRSHMTLRGRVKKHPRRNILIVGVGVPERLKDLENVMAALSLTSHSITTRIAPLGEGRGKFQNINACLKGVEVNNYDWLIIIDDDIAFPDGFLDKFIYLAECADLQISMPAHKFNSYQTFKLTLRHWNSLVRVTHFVESGPLTAFRNPIFPYVLPFADLRWAWGTDIAWCEAARNRGFRIGIVDGAPIRHLRPVAQSYDWTLAANEAKAFLSEAKIAREKRDVLQTVEVLSRL